MTPVPSLQQHYGGAFIPRAEVTKPTDPNGLVLEAWAEGYMVGSLIILSCITGGCSHTEAQVKKEAEDADSDAM